MTLNELTARIVGWAQDRNLIEGSTPIAQLGKLTEETCETWEGILNNDRDEVKDGHGDMYVVATIMAAQLGSSILRPEAEPSKAADTMEVFVALGKVASAVVRHKREESLQALWDFKRVLEMSASQDFGYFTLEEAVEHAWNQIKDRKGRMVNGTFIKEGEDVKTTH